MEENKEVVVFGGGCFWCTEAIFKMLKGVISVNPGYAGGTKENPTYEEVSNGKTGHAEVVKIEYDQNKISFKNLLTVFFATHDPTTKNRQGNDVGEQYRSIILYTNEKQQKIAQDFIEELNNSDANGGKIETEVKPLDKFYEAESYHNNYYEKNLTAGRQGKNKSYCQIVINPKLKKVQEKFAELLN
ncbi:MAG: peptide-methionine (S)-S-oxide reductase MsrA [Candidatus Staskawiczbacteria bacterium]|nr:peptide-methionine (S)-S-oxide reductase MsrA [Candidatus Staskawiczbacteria bacterium]MBI3337321.1 peptide-methionine (S)-S-oxide reductase MsrA [Candidatus Staskawiczbacteria bacterium]